MTAHYTLHDDVAVLTLDNPPVNSMGFATREALATGLARALADASVRAIVITGANGLFTGGADIREFGLPAAMRSPNLHELIARLEEAAKPVIAAINSTCMGGGTEISLGCHYRVAAPGALIGLPEVKLGLLPGAGGTQRLPRAMPDATGVALALEMIASGDPVKAEALVRAGAVDRIIDGDFLAGTIAFAREAVASSVRPRLRDRTIPLADTEPFFAAAREKIAAASRHFPAPLKCVEAVEAAVRLPISEGLALEYRLFAELLATPASRALRHAFFAERAASRIPDIAEDTPTRRVERVAVIGAGTMGGGIATALLNAGLPVTILETSQEALDRGIAVMRKNYEGTVAKGRLTAEKMNERLGRLAPSLDYEALRDADLIIEAVFEDMAVKQQVFEALDRVAKPGAILASNTSTLDLDKIARFTRRPWDVIGMHFFSPAHVMKLLEVVRGQATAPEVLATVMRLARKIGKTAVVSGVCDGFIGNRMIEQYSRQALFLLEEGASVAQIDAALETFGFAMGPFRMSDMAGNDVSWYVRKRRYRERPELPYSRIADRLCEAGRFGQKTGAGWYDYQPGDRKPHPSAFVDELVADYRAERGLVPRAIDDEEIVGRLVYALVNEGARLLEEGIAQRASDIDIVYLTGYGFPSWCGGPMHYADQVGLSRIAAEMRRFATNPAADPAFWTPAPLLEKCMSEGRNLTD